MLRQALRGLRRRVWLEGSIGKGWRDAVWPIAEEGRGGLRLLSGKERDVFAGLDATNVTDERARTVFERETRRWTRQSDKVLVAEDVRVDPVTGIAISADGRRVRETFGIHPEVTPSYLTYRANRIGLSPVKLMDEAVHFDGFLGTNLWHFFQDSLNALLLLDSSDEVRRDIPLLIGRRVWEMPYAQHILRLPPFADRRWVVLDRDWVRVGRLYKAEAAFDWFDRAYSILGESVAKTSGDRLFLNRRPRFGRTISNLAAIEPVLAARGFRTVFAEDHSYDEQARMFAAASAIVAIHGAGLTNCLFADIPRLRCLELQADDYINPHYFWLLRHLGVERYDCLVGSQLDTLGTFDVDVAAFTRQLDALLA